MLCFRCVSPQNMVVSVSYQDAKLRYFKAHTPFVWLEGHKLGKSKMKFVLICG